MYNAYFIFFLRKLFIVINSKPCDFKKYDKTNNKERINTNNQEKHIKAYQSSINCILILLILFYKTSHIRIKLFKTILKFYCITFSFLQTINYLICITCYCICCCLQCLKRFCNWVYNNSLLFRDISKISCRII